MNTIKISADSLAYFHAMANHSDEDFAGCGNPLGIVNDDECENDLNGNYGSYNNIWVQVEGDAGEAHTINIHEKE